jgi:subtilisin family serine protease
VASIDTGVQWDHPALINSYKCQANPNDPACWYDPTGTCPSGPCDNNGHGTATMGPIVGDDDPAILYQVGLAPGAQWIACKGCSSSACSDVDLIACADWILARRVETPPTAPTWLATLGEAVVAVIGLIHK